MAESAINTLSADQIGGVGYEPQRQNNIYIFIDGLDADEALKLALVSFPLPKVTNNVIEVPHGNETRKFAGKPTFEDISVVLNDNVDNDVSDKLIAWRKKVYNEQTGQIGWARDYWKPGKVYAYGPDGRVTRKWHLQGIWPSGYDPGDADQSSDDVVKITMTLTINKAWYEGRFA
jgi:hypothetical protein